MTQHDENLIELVGPTNEGWYRTQIPDWIALHPDLKDGAFRLYVILRSLILEKQKTKIRVLSYDQIGASAMMSRAVAGLVSRPRAEGADTFIFALPGSSKAVELGVRELIAPQLGHLVWLRRK